MGSGQDSNDSHHWLISYNANFKFAGNCLNSFVLFDSTTKRKLMAMNNKLWQKCTLLDKSVKMHTSIYAVFLCKKRVLVVHLILNCTVNTYESCIVPGSRLFFLACLLIGFPSSSTMKSSTSKQGIDSH